MAPQTLTMPYLFPGFINRLGRSIDIIKLYLCSEFRFNPPSGQGEIIVLWRGTIYLNY